MATSSKLQPAERQKAQRLPAPSLFVGPPSRNVSSVSLQPASTNSDSVYNGRPSLSRQTSLANERAGGRLTGGSPSSPATSRPENQFASLDANASPAGGMLHTDERERGGSGGGLPGTGRPVLNRAPSKLQQELQQPLHRAETHRRAGVDGGRPPNPSALTATMSNTPNDPKAGQKQTAEDKTEALWASMQNTLEEVELSASTKNHSVFGPEHAKALEELRTAQIALAHAWGKSEADEVPGSTEQSGLTAGRLKDMEHEHEIGKSDIPHEMHSPSAILNSARRSEHPSAKTRARAESTASTATTASERGSNGGHNNSKSLLEEETENDIRLARRRREANDRYFDKVSKGVLEVVQKLELVAISMKNVEMESREIWRDIDREGEGDQSDKGSDVEDGRGEQK